MDKVRRRFRPMTRAWIMLAAGVVLVVFMAAHPDHACAQDDPYEQNDTYTQAYNLSMYDLTWLSSIAGLGVQADEDWYQIYVSPDYERVVVYCTFTDTDGDIDIALYDSSGNAFTPVWGNRSSASTSDNEYIDCEVPLFGTYYIRVSYGDAGNDYDLLWDDLWPGADDSYEQNDTYTQAYDLRWDEMTWLSSIIELGVQADDDWYRINVTPGEEIVVVGCLFSHSAGDIDIELCDISGNTFTPVSGIPYSESTTDDEYIICEVPSPGTYYIRVYFDNVGNTYDLWWDDTSAAPSDDFYEPNNTYTEAYDLSLNEQTWLSSIAGLGIQADDDWYEIYVNSGSEQVVVDCTFTNADGDIDIVLYDSTGSTFTPVSGNRSSTGVSDDEHIDCVVPSFGTYYICVYYDNAGNTYDLWWDDLSLTGTVDLYDDGEAWSGFSPTTAAAGDAFSAWCDIRNGGTDPSGPFNVHFYASADTAISTADYYIGTKSMTSIAGGAFAGCDWNGTFPLAVPAGLYYVGWIIDATGVVSETNESNNTAYKTGYQLTVTATDDFYEPNNSYTEAYDLSSDKQTYLSSINGLGIQADDDWFEIYVTPGFERVVVDCFFSHSTGNIDIELRDSSGNSFTPFSGNRTSTSVTDDERIDCVVPSSGTYYIRVYLTDAGNAYNLWWDDGPSHSVAITSSPSGTPNPCDSGGTVNCSVTASCSLGHTLSYSWSATSGSFSDPSSMTPTWDAPGNTSGSTQNYTISVTATCSGGLSDSGSFSQGVMSAVGHSVVITSGPSGAPNPCDSQASVSCSITANCSSGHTLSYSWSATDGTFSDPGSMTPIWYAPTNTSGSTQNYTISVTATCSGGLSDSGSFSQDVKSGMGHNVTITSGPSGTPNPCDSQANVSCSVTASCSLVHTLSYSWSATDGSFSDPNSRTPTWYAPGNTSGSMQYCAISVLVTCSGGLSYNVSFSQSVRTEHDVVITAGPSGTPSPCDSQAGVSCSVTAICSLGHALGYSWSATGASFPNPNSRTPIWYAPTNTSGSTQNYTISVTVTCSGGASDSGSFSQDVRSGTPIAEAENVSQTGGCSIAATGGGIHDNGRALGYFLPFLLLSLYIVSQRLRLRWVRT